MTIIRLPLTSEDCQDENETENVKIYLEGFINNTYKEIKEVLSSYHPIKEIEGRKKLANFFRQKSYDYELLQVFMCGIKYLDRLPGHTNKIETMLNKMKLYEENANRLANMFEGMKNTISPLYDVEGAISVRLGYQNTFPDLIQKNKVDEIKEFHYIDRLSKIYLEREDLYSFDQVVIEKGIVFLYIDDFKFNIALCGDLNAPSWKLLDIVTIENTENHIIQDRPSIIRSMKSVFRTFSISKLSIFMKIYNRHFQIKSLHKEFKNASKHLDLHVEGGYKKFSVDLYPFSLSVYLEDKEMRIIGLLKHEGDVTIIKNNIISSLEEYVTSKVKNRGNIKFNLKAGYDFTDDNVNNNIIMIYDSFSYKHLVVKNPYHKAKRGRTVPRSITFLSYKKLEEFLTIRKIEDEFYKKIEKLCDKNFRCIRNHKLFGEKNVFLQRNDSYVVVKLHEINESEIKVFIYLGVHKISKVLDFLNFKIVEDHLFYHGEICDKEHMNCLSIEIFYKFLEDNLFFLFCCKDLSRISKKIKVNGKIIFDEDTSIEINNNRFILRIKEIKFYKETIEDASKHIFFIRNVYEKIERDEMIFNVKKKYEELELLFGKIRIELCFMNTIKMQSSHSFLHNLIKDVDITSQNALIFLKHLEYLVAERMIPSYVSVNILVFDFKFQNKLCCVKSFISRENKIKRKFYLMNKESREELDVNLVKEWAYRERFDFLSNLFKTKYKTFEYEDHIEACTNFMRFSLMRYSSEFKIIDIYADMDVLMIESRINEKIIDLDYFDIIIFLDKIEENLNH